MAGNDEGAVERHRPPCPQAISTRTVHVAPTGRSRVSSSVAHHDGTYRARRLGLRALDACVREAARSHRGARDARLVANILIEARAFASPPEPGNPVSIAPDYRAWLLGFRPRRPGLPKGLRSANHWEPVISGDRSPGSEALRVVPSLRNHCGRITAGEISKAAARRFLSDAAALDGRGDRIRTCDPLVPNDQPAISPVAPERISGRPAWDSRFGSTPGPSPRSCPGDGSRTPRGRRPDAPLPDELRRSPEVTSRGRARTSRRGAMRPCSCAARSRKCSRAWSTPGDGPRGSPEGR